MKTNLKCLYGAFLILAAAGVARADDPTAFALVRAGDKYVGDQSKDLVVQIRSDKSVAGLTPRVWYVVYYDPDAPLKAVEVKFGAGQKLDVSRPLRLLEPVTGADKVLESSKLKVDSDRALNIALAQPMLQGIAVRSSQFWLQHSETGPRWKIKLWASKVTNLGKEAEIGDLYVSTVDGSVVQADYHLNRLD